MKTADTEMHAANEVGKAEKGRGREREREREREKKLPLRGRQNNTHHTLTAV